MKKLCMWKSLSTTRHLSHAPTTIFTTRRRTLSSSSSFDIKNVTKSNFESALKDLRGLLRDADFVAVDLEMTGVTSAPWRESFDYDRYDISYLKVKDSAEKFAVVQFGVCPFRWDPHKQSFIAHPHNFYIFPRQEIPGSNQSREFLCQTTSLDFLAKYQFDFNLCIREGISYLSRSQEKEALERISSIYMDESSDSVFGLSEDADFPLVRMADVLFAERMKNTIREWRDSLLSKGSSSSEIKQISTDPSQRFQMVFFKTRPGIALSDFTSRQLRVIKAVTKKHFKDLAYIRVAGESTSPQQLIVYTDSNDDRDLLMKEVKDGLRKEAEMKVESAVGFRHVIDLLSSEQKLIIGHNCFLDVAHMYSKFIGPLPSTAQPSQPAGGFNNNINNNMGGPTSTASNANMNALNSVFGAPAAAIPPQQYQQQQQPFQQQQMGGYPPGFGMPPPQQHQQQPQQPFGMQGFPGYGQPAQPQQHYQQQPQQQQQPFGASPFGANPFGAAPAPAPAAGYNPFAMQATIQPTPAAYARPPTQGSGITLDTSLWQ